LRDPKPSAGNKQVYVQAGAYGSKAKANEVKSRLSKLGQVSITPTERAGMKLWRVRVAANNSSAAEKIRGKMTGMGFGGAKIVKN
jgi:cell division protein FtsN